MSNQDIALMAHLMRRAGFGASRSELEEYVAKGYEATVEELLNPGDPQNLPDDIIRRYHVDQSELRQLDGAGANWMYRMITTKCPLEEKGALFWHSLFATGYSKLNQARSLLNQIDMFRRHGLGRFDNILVELSKDPAMIIWLDNNDNHKGAINENFGRELLEAFLDGYRQLHRGRHQRVRPRLHRMDAEERRIHVHSRSKRLHLALQPYRVAL